MGEDESLRGIVVCKQIMATVQLKGRVGMGTV